MSADGAMMVLVHIAAVHGRFRCRHPAGWTPQMLPVDSKAASLDFESWNDAASVGLRSAAA